MQFSSVYLLCTVKNVEEPAAFSPVLLFLTKKKKGWSTITWGYSTAILLMAIIPKGKRTQATC